MAMISLDSLMGNSGPSYPEQIVAPYRKELVDAGFEQMMTVEEVEKILSGNTARGKSRAPPNGKTGMATGSSDGFR